MTFSSMDESQISHEIRPFEIVDREAILDFSNEDRPEHQKLSLPMWEQWDGLRDAGGEVYERWCVGTPAVAYLDILDKSTSHWKMDDVCEFNLRVANSRQRQGIGAALYEKVLAFAASRGAKRLMTAFSLRQGDATPALAFLTKRGFTEMERDQPSYLPLVSFDITPYLPAIADAECRGIRLFAYGDLPDTPENRRRLYDLFATLIYHIPRNDDQPFTVETFEEWNRMISTIKEFNPSLYWLAEIDSEWIGMTQLMPKTNSLVLMQWLTAVLPAHRGKGLATALKAKAYLTAQTQGYSVVATDNHETNGPMLAVNKKFGFIPEHPHVVYNKVLPQTGE